MAQLHREQQPTLRVPVVNQTLISKPGGTSPARVVLCQRYQTQHNAATKVQMYILVTHHQDLTHMPWSDHLKAVMASAATYRMTNVATQVCTQHLLPRTCRLVRGVRQPDGSSAVA
uniref:Uncharacterized protein n=1 Tax=Spumella elongata TaxID=89044 RepID=A0A7S3LY96_9STRA|mmetsp:Transcript_11905/g.20948  ORF Transcript_11905/g.20948 Transcript_11905/m.20948 type:complete len:116 (+) Transcript_11905:110-457(+)